MASTTGIESWAVDLADVGPIYPFQGTETLLVIVAAIAWVGWHVVQMVGEKRELEEKVRRFGDKENVARTGDTNGD